MGGRWASEVGDRHLIDKHVSKGHARSQSKVDGVVDTKDWLPISTEEVTTSPQAFLYGGVGSKDILGRQKS